MDEYEISEDNPEVKLGYYSSHNITFKGELETGLSVKEWSEMSEENKDDIIQNMTNDLVDVWVLERGESVW